MKKATLFLIVALLAMGSAALRAQTEPTPFGYISLQEVIECMPEYAKAQEDFAKLQESYNAEIIRSEKELTRKYINFLQDEAGLAENIKTKRQKELQDFMERNMQFKGEIQRTLESASDSLYTPVKNRALDAIHQVCMEQHLAYVVNTDKDCFLVINGEGGGIDITRPVKLALGLKVEEEMAPGITQESPEGTPAPENAPDVTPAIIF